MIKNILNNNHFINFFYILLGAFFLMLPAIYNGYPIIYEDSGFYIVGLPAAIIENQTSPLRSIAYSLLFPSSLYATLWFPLIIQSLLNSFLLKICIASLLQKNRNRIFLLIILFLTLFSSLAWYNSELLSDAYLGIIIIAITCIVFTPMTKKIKIIMFPIIIWMIMTHNSYMLLVVTLSTALVFFQIFRLYINKFFSLAFLNPIFQKISWKSLFIITIFPWICTFLLNFFVTGKFQYSKGGPVFLTARLAEIGIVEDWLNDVCDKEFHRLCPYKDNITISSQDFIWAEYSPLAKEGGDTNFAALKDYNFMIKQILTTPKYFYIFMIDSIKKTIHLLFSFNVGKGVFLEGTLIYYVISKYFNANDTSLTEKYYKNTNNFINKIIDVSNKITIYFDDYSSYISSKQSKGKLQLKIYTVIITIVCFISFIIILLFLIIPKYRNSLSSYLISLIILCIFAIIMNALICASLSGIPPRYNARVIWILPFCAVLLLINYALEKKNKLLLSFFYKFSNNKTKS